MRKEIILIGLGPRGRPWYVYCENEGEWVFRRKFMERAEAEGCVSNEPLMPGRELYRGGVLITDLADL